MSEVKIGAEEFRWDLGFMYSDVEDSAIDEDFGKLIERLGDFSDSYRGRLSENLGAAILDYSEIRMLGNKIFVYLALLQSLNTGDSVVKAKVASLEKAYNEASALHMAFFDIELARIDDEVLERLYSSDEVVLRHRSWIEHARLFKPHLLSEEVESALIKRSSFGVDSWSEFFDEVESDLEFLYSGKVYTLTEMLNLLNESKDSDERFEIMSIVNSGLGGFFAKYSAQTLHVVCGLGDVNRRDRKYDHPMESRNKSNRVGDEVVEVLHKVVLREAGPLARRYYRLKAAHLGVDKLRWSDRNAPMPFSDTSIVPFDKARNICVEAYGSFSPVLADLIRGMFDEKRVDAPAVKGKRGGAFNYSIVLPGGKSVSFNFLNYLGSSRDVMTTAHELGHAVHGLLAGEAQGPLMGSAPIAYAETASVFGEMTTFNFLKKGLLEKGDKESLLALIMGKIDDIINTVVRQIGFSNFERRIHGMDKDYLNWGEVSKLSVEELNEIWLCTLKEFYGEDGEVFTYENMEYLWSYVSHFHRPFYVYGYAFGQLLTSGLYARQEAIGGEFESLYLDLLRSGSTRDAVQLMKPFGLDPRDEEFWVDAIKVGLGDLIDEAERLSEELAISR